METANQPGEENPDQVTSDEQGASPAKSYECTFCKRGFSNAQALGGHMNIHRRDKAKLKQASPSETSSQPSLDIAKIFPSYSPNHPSCTTQPIPDVRSSQEIIRSSPGKWPWVVQEDDVNKRDKTCHVGSEIRQLPLFYENPLITDQNPSSQVQGGIEKGLSSSSQGSSGSSELDLELRLGPEPQDSSPPLTTKKFF